MNQIKGRLFENEMSETKNNNIKYTRIALAVKYSEMYFKVLYQTVVWLCVTS
jgi:hypothetical protein